MNKIILLLLVTLLIYSCIGKHNSNAQEATVVKKQKEQISLKADTLQIDLSNSSVFWKGTKMRGAGKHEGQLQLQSAFLLSGNGYIIGGQFIVDMTTIGVTDIPEHEPVPIRNLNNHLKSVDFFEVEKYPTSKFVITKTENLSNDSISLSGNLTIKDITKNIIFKASSNGNDFSTKFTFNRFQWNIAYEGIWADKTLVDRDVELTINLKMK
jgi:PBP1b-binding outer membrane lipoprotein LpoB